MLHDFYISRNLKREIQNIEVKNPSLLALLLGLLPTTEGDDALVVVLLVVRVEDCLVVVMVGPSVMTEVKRNGFVRDTVAEVVRVGRGRGIGGFAAPEVYQFP